MGLNDDIDFGPEALAKFYGNRPKQAKLQYHDLKLIDSRLAALLSPDAFLKDMVKRGELDEITENYSRDCFMMCENSVAWALLQLRAHPEYACKILIQIGSFFRAGVNVRGEHYWLLLKTPGKDYYIDLTLAQFIKGAPRLAVIDAVDSEGSYNTWQVVTAEEYIAGLANQR
jgi:hypothetical protein